MASLRAELASAALCWRLAAHCKAPSELAETSVNLVSGFFLHLRRVWQALCVCCATQGCAIETTAAATTIRSRRDLSAGRARARHFRHQTRRVARRVKLATEVAGLRHSSLTTLLPAIEYFDSLGGRVAGKWQVAALRAALTSAPLERQARKARR